MKLILSILVSCLLVSCVTQKKVNSWLDEHPTEAAGYCAYNFPPDTTTRIVTDFVDTAAYERAYWEMARYADSLFGQLEKDRNEFKPSPAQPCPPKVNLDSLRKAVDVEIRRRLTPCKDSIQKVVYTVIDKAKERELQGKLDEKDQTITARDKRVTELEAKNKSLKKWPWLFLALVVAIAGYAVLKLRFKLPI